MPPVTASRATAPVLATAAGLFMALAPHAQAQWWKHAPADFEECADLAETSATKLEKTAALAKCNAKFAGRRKPGGGYTYYDFMQERTFDIAGPNPTPEEQKRIDQAYATYLADQHSSDVAAETALRRLQRQQEIQQVSLESEVERVPLPVQRPKHQALSGDARPRSKSASCAKGSFSCEWPRLSEGWNDLKRLFNPPSAKAKKG